MREARPIPTKAPVGRSMPGEWRGPGEGDCPGTDVGAGAGVLLGAEVGGDVPSSGGELGASGVGG